jgi:hypothetical protein
VESNILLGLHGENLHVASAYGKIEEVAWWILMQEQYVSYQQMFP